MKLSEMLKNYRTENKISQREFARRCELSHSLISLMEMGKNPQTGKAMSPDLDTYRKLAAGMQTSLQDLFEKLGNDAAVDLSNAAKPIEPVKITVRRAPSSRLFATDAIPTSLRKKNLTTPGLRVTKSKTNGISEAIIKSAEYADNELNALMKLWKVSTPERRKKIVRVIREICTDEQ